MTFNARETNQEIIAEYKAGVKNTYNQRKKLAKHTNQSQQDTLNPMIEKCQPIVTPTQSSSSLNVTYSVGSSKNTICYEDSLGMTRKWSYDTNTMYTRNEHYHVLHKQTFMNIETNFINPHMQRFEKVVGTLIKLANIDPNYRLQAQKTSELYAALKEKTNALHAAATLSHEEVIHILQNCKEIVITAQNEEIFAQHHERTPFNV